MKARELLIASVLLMICGNVFGAAPVVIEAVPDNGETNVDPGLRQIKIVFDQDMSKGGYSVCGGGEKFPKIGGKPKWINKRTLAMRVRLEANKEYQFSINCQSAGNCRGANGESAEPYPISFKTGADTGTKKRRKKSPGAVPEVIEAVPDDGERNVDPSLGQIKIVFDQDMKQAGFSICGGGDKFPDIDGNPKWDGRTLVMDVNLKPNKIYQFSINCPSAGGCKGANGVSAEPYPISFKTSGAGSEQKSAAVSKKDNYEAIKTLRKAINDKYSYKKLRGVNFNSLIRQYAPQMRDASSAEEFAEYTAKILKQAKDIHVWVKTEDQNFSGYKRNVKRNYNYDVLEEMVPGWKKQNNTFYTGKYPDGTGYMLINSWSNSRKNDIDDGCKLLERMLRSCDKMIIDARPNSGGSETLARLIAGYFVDEPVVYAKHVYRDKRARSGFGKVNERVLEPKEEGEKYAGNVVVLMGQENMSSNEAFLLMMRQVENCKLIGETSYGSSANPKAHDLGNGVTVWLPSWKAMRADGSCFEEEGIEPDITVAADEEEFEENDPVLKEALLYLKS